MKRVEFYLGLLTYHAWLQCFSRRQVFYIQSLNQDEHKGYHPYNNLAWGHLSLTGWITLRTWYWHMLELFSLPWGRTFHWYHSEGDSLLMVGTVKRNFPLSWGVRGIVKKQSFKSMTSRARSLGIIAGDGSPCWSGPIGWRTALIALTSCNNHHCPDLLGITKIGEFQGLIEGSVCPNFNCSWIKAFACNSLSPLRGHYSTQTGFEVSHVKGRGGIRTVVPVKRGYPQFSFPSGRVRLSSPQSNGCC